MFEVYLFELKSVTVAATQGIVRTFRNRPGDFLLVLTDDYRRLDFVLVERYNPEFPKLQDTFTLVPAAPTQPGVRPHVLTVNRRNPEPVALRVLRRFSYTEADTFAQYDKLLSAYVVADWSKPFPIRRITFATPASERAYNLEKARNLYEYCLDKNDQACVTGFVAHHLSKEPEESGVAHDLLAFLAEEMMRLNKEKRAAQKEFLDWLVATLKILPDRDGRKGIEVLTGKSKIADYPGDYQKGESPLAFEELLDILLRNKGRLYGLTEEEIKIVEGKA
jgi:hypothetical protein